MQHTCLLGATLRESVIEVLLSTRRFVVGPRVWCYSVENDQVHLICSEILPAELNLASHILRTTACIQRMHQ